MSKVTVGRSNAYSGQLYLLTLEEEEVITALCVHGFHKIKQVQKLVLHANSVWRI